jgi:hypothetical protein
MPNLYEAVQRHTYEPGDYLLIDDQGEDMGVSGNSEFDDLEGIIMPRRYVIIKVIEVQDND